MKKTFACPNCKTHQQIEGEPGEKIILTCKNCNSTGLITLKLERTISCPKCKNQETIKGLPNEKIVLDCKSCGTQGFVSFKEKKPVPSPVKVGKPTKSHKFLTRKQVAVISVSIIILCTFIFAIMIPTMNNQLHFLTVLSGSMEPEMHTGDIVISSMISPSEINVGDIITFEYNSERDPDRYVTHRVIEIVQVGDRYNFKTKGDANEDPDMGLVTEDKLVGKVIMVLPYFGHVGNFARSPLGYVVFLLIPAALVIGYEIRRIYKTTKKKNAI